MANGYIVMRNSDNDNNLLKNDEHNYVYLKMLRKCVDRRRKIIPVCLKCNEKETTDAIIIGSKHVLKDNAIENQLVNCRHEKFKKDLFFIF